MYTEFIAETKVKLFGGTEEFVCQLIRREAGTATVLYEVPETRYLGSLMLPKGTLSFGYFREDRNYNVYHFVTRTGATLATYFNVSDQTRVTAAAINWRDLVVDILVTPQQGCEVLDEDELPGELDPALARLITETRDYVVLNHYKLVREVGLATATHLAALNPGSLTTSRDS